MADRLGIVDNPNGRSSHKKRTLRGGGIIFLVGAWLYSAFFGSPYPWFLAGVTLVAAVSFIDDIRSLSDQLRLIVQFASIFLMFCQLGILNWENWWIILIAGIVCVGIANAYNFMDGINGITGGYSLAVVIPLMYINVETPFIDPNYLYVTGLSLLVFCFFNFRTHAKCFAGDVGSLSMAYMVVFALGRLILQTNDFSYILLLALYGVDSVLTICHRILLHENLGQAHRKHAYQLLSNELGIPHIVVSSIYMFLQLCISFGLIYLKTDKWIYFFSVVALLTVIYVVFMRKYYPLHEAYLKSINTERIIR